MNSKGFELKVYIQITKKTSAEASQAYMPSFIWITKPQMIYYACQSRSKYFLIRNGEIDTRVWGWMKLFHYAQTQFIDGRKKSRHTLNHKWFIKPTKIDIKVRILNLIVENENNWNLNCIIGCCFAWKKATNHSHSLIILCRKNIIVSAVFCSCFYENRSQMKIPKWLVILPFVLDITWVTSKYALDIKLN